ncbi:MAG: DUF2085 domain-containing protein [Acidobacteriota bacterium]
MTRPFVLGSSALIALVWVGGLLAAPAWGSRSSHRSNGSIAEARVAISAAMYVAGSLVCHQRPERSFHVDGLVLPVCARCLGLYAGGLLGIAGWAGVSGLGRRPARRACAIVASGPPRSALVVAALPTLVTVVTAWLGWWDPANLLRASTAIPLGAVAGALVSAVLAGDLR